MSPKSTTNTPANVLPFFYFHFFTFVEPLLTIFGSIYATFSPLQYYTELVPIAVASPPLAINVHPAGIMAVRQLGSCFFLLALVGSVFLRHMATTLKDQPRILETLVASYLWCLAVADLTHIGYTLFDVGTYVAIRPSLWNQLVFGNVAITSFLLVVRITWFYEIARGSVSRTETKKRT
ncbi:BQ2448_2904 [Microbotryum intermedium]|uniref:BQ2448_2904 protein n=1 Tax=Microbotryum intermedium TaxID=269621 RepID=A0A238FJR0_9BASI|nr:BQ2448_2904 [Microbotryum intermedium]